MGQINGKKILLVEDDKFLSEMVAKKFVEEGVVLSYADNGQVALDMIKNNSFDMVVLDLLLPMVSGFDVLKEIRANEKTKNIPVVLLSNLGQKEDVDKGMELGANKFLIKAIMSIDEIVEQISSVMQGVK